LTEGAVSETLAGHAVPRQGESLSVLRHKGERNV
jgi:hypothetical protein